jgi:hypothetical protein
MKNIYANTAYRHARTKLHKKQTYMIWCAATYLQNCSVQLRGHPSTDMLKEEW